MDNQKSNEWKIREWKIWIMGNLGNAKYEFWETWVTANLGNGKSREWVSWVMGNLHGEWESRVKGKAG
jgi:hypothetical protein